MLPFQLQCIQFVIIFLISRHERIHTKKGSHMNSQIEADEVDDLATMEVLDEVNKSKKKKENQQTEL